jgi:hypothetical protein
MHVLIDWIKKELVILNHALVLFDRAETARADPFTGSERTAQLIRIYSRTAERKNTCQLMTSTSL